MIRSLLQRLGNALAALFGRRSKSASEFRKSGGVVAFQLLQQERVRTELNLNIEQVGQILRLTRQARQLRRREFIALRNQDRQQAAGAGIQLQRAVAAEVLAGLNKAAVLTPEQKERLRQIVWQRQGAGAFAHPLVQENLKLTPGQKEVIRSILEELRQRVRTLRQGAAEGGEPPAPGALQKEALNRALALLDEEQKGRWEQLKGKPFEFQDVSAGPEDADAGSDEPAP
jgi:hypothetical protein